MHFYSYINQRNRMRNLIDAEEAAKVEVAAMKNAAADPFTRRQCRPTMVTRVSLFLFYFFLFFLLSHLTYSNAICLYRQI